MKIRAALVFIGVVAWLVLRTPRKKPRARTPQARALLASERSAAIKAACKHVPFEPVSGSIPYAEVCQGGIDGCGREHADVYIMCARCYGTYIVCRIHLPEREAERTLIAENKQLCEKLSHFMEGI